MSVPWNSGGGKSVSCEVIKKRGTSEEELAE